MDEPSHFPANRQAAVSSLADQMDKVEEEASELYDEVSRRIEGAHNDFDLCREAWDVIQATEGILRKFPCSTVEDAKEAVVERCRNRGDY